MSSLVIIIDPWRTNFAKVDPVTGRVTRREDGKILKPEGWQPPELKRYLHEQ